jgi:hypothetical protein
LDSYTYGKAKADKALHKSILLRLVECTAPVWDAFAT